MGIRPDLQITETQAQSIVDRVIPGHAVATIVNIHGGEIAAVYEIGLAGYLFSRTPRGPANYDGTPREFSTAYGGLLLRYALFADFPVYGSLGVFVGGGAVVLRDEWEYYRRDRNLDSDSNDYVTRRETSDDYFVAQPDITLHVNATRWLRVGVTGGYRFASAVQRFGYDSTAMSGAVVGGNIELGWF